MSSIVVSGDTSGAITVAAPTTAGTSTLTLPSGASGTIAAQGVSTNIVSGTAVASTSGTSFDFTGIPSWVKRVTVMFAGVSTSGSSYPLFQLGAGSVTTSGYVGSQSNVQNAGTTAVISQTAGFGLFSNVATYLVHGSAVFTNLTGNTWVCSGNFISTGPNLTVLTNAGYIALGGTLDRVRITTVNGTDTFDAGSINILYE
jgi:hypothetical protein